MCVTHWYLIWKIFFARECGYFVICRIFVRPLNKKCISGIRPFIFESLLIWSIPEAEYSDIILSSNYCIQILYAHTKAQVCEHKGTSKISFLQIFYNICLKSIWKVCAPKGTSKFSYFQIDFPPKFWKYEHFDVPLCAHTCALVCAYKNFIQ